MEGLLEVELMERTKDVFVKLNKTAFAEPWECDGNLSLRHRDNHGVVFIICISWAFTRLHYEQQQQRRERQSTVQRRHFTASLRVFDCLCLRRRISLIN